LTGTGAGRIGNADKRIAVIIVQKKTTVKWDVEIATPSAPARCSSSRPAIPESGWKSACLPLA